MRLNAPKQLLVTRSVHLGMAGVGVDGVDGVVVAEVAVVVEGGIGGGIMTVILRRRVKESNRQERKASARMPVWA